MAIKELFANTVDEHLNEQNIHKWAHIISVIDVKHVYEQTISIVEADKYIFDFNGLLQSFNIPEKYWFPHVILNNFSSSTDYDGRKKIYIIDNAILSNIYSHLINDSLN